MAINRIIDAPVQVRQIGDTTIIPLRDRKSAWEEFKDTIRRAWERR